MQLEPLPVPLLLPPVVPLLAPELLLVLVLLLVAGAPVPLLVLDAPAAPVLGGDEGVLLLAPPLLEAPPPLLFPPPQLAAVQRKRDPRASARCMSVFMSARIRQSVLLEHQTASRGRPLAVYPDPGWATANTFAPRKPPAVPVHSTPTFTNNDPPPRRPSGRPYAAVMGGSPGGDR
jgi:hypothetical protein